MSHLGVDSRWGCSVAYLPWTRGEDGIQLTIDSESFRELTDTNDLPSSLQEKA
jgi:hypothetical protein